jgi:hypothetical protein
MQQCKYAGGWRVDRTLGLGDRKALPVATFFFFPSEETFFVLLNSVLN